VFLYMKDVVFCFENIVRSNRKDIFFGTGEALFAYTLSLHINILQPTSLVSRISINSNC